MVSFKKQVQCLEPSFILWSLSVKILFRSWFAWKAMKLKLDFYLRFSFELSILLSSVFLLVFFFFFLRNDRLSARSARKRVEHPLPRSACARRENLLAYTWFRSKSQSGYGTCAKGQKAEKFVRLVRGRKIKGVWEAFIIPDSQNINKDGGIFFLEIGVLQLVFCIESHFLYVMTLLLAQCIL